MKIKYQIENFKAFSNSGIIELSPITVLCGANSSGKSSIIKSILLAKQSASDRRSALKSTSPAQPMILNGPLTKLGAWSDVVHGRDRSKSINFNWSVQLSNAEHDEVMGRHNQRAWPSRNADVKSEDHKSIALTITVSSDHSMREELSVMVEKWTASINNLSIEISKENRNDQGEAIYVTSVSKVKDLVRRSGPRLRSYTSPFGDLYKALATCEDRIELGNVTPVTVGPFITRLEPIFDKSWTPFYEKIYNIALSDRGRRRGPTPGWIADLGAAVRSLKKTSNDAKGAEQRVAVHQALLMIAFDFASSVSAVFSEVKAALSPMWNDIRYLGPLRDQPRRYYQFDDAGGADVGVSGEFTVQVLALEQFRTIRCTRLDSKSGGNLEFASSQVDSLLDHTNFWLSWMGLPQVSPSSLHQSLYRIEVGDLKVGLLDVGFGVSQVLPIIVEALRAEKGDLVILEQPEIHLHPRVQAQLADFMLARAKDGIRFLVESHSEYLIKRLCRRIAESDGMNANDSTNIIFVEEGGEGSRCYPISLNAFGEIDNWPKGFFDLDEDLYWTQASLVARRRAKDKAL